MSENINQNDLNIDNITLRIALGINRKRSETDLDDVIKSLNKYESVKKNPSNDPSEALGVLYSTLDRTNHFLVSGADTYAFEKIKNVMEGVRSRIPGTIGDFDAANNQIEKLKAKPKKELSRSVLALIFSNDMENIAVLEITPRVE